jgi:hypothetical protein
LWSFAELTLTGTEINNEKSYEEKREINGK